MRANIKHKLDSVTNETDITIDEDYGSYTQTQIQIILVFCLDYLIGLADFHVCHKVFLSYISDYGVKNKRQKKWRRED